ncbi:MAG: AMP-binding protein, partial [Pyrinomonadaceae bacterium]
MPLTEFVLQRANALGDKPALVEGTSGRVITYRQLSESIRRAAVSLARRGLRKGDVLAIYSPNLPEYAVAFHAVARLGGINTTVNPLYTADELAFQLGDAGAKYLLTVPQLLDKSLEAAGRSQVQEVFVIGQAEGATSFDELLGDEGEMPEVKIDPRHDLVALPYSS